MSNLDMSMTGTIAPGRRNCKPVSADHCEPRAADSCELPSVGCGLSLFSAPDPEPDELLGCSGGALGVDLNDVLTRGERGQRQIDQQRLPLRGLDRHVGHR